MTERKVLACRQQSLYKPVMQPCPPHGHGERLSSTRPPARIFYLTISLLLAFLANCEKAEPPSPPGAPPTPPQIVAFDKLDPNLRKALDEERTKLERFRIETEKAKKSNSIQESEYKRNIKEYEQRMTKNRAAFEKLKPGN
jgi:hypothetical protein